MGLMIVLAGALLGSGAFLLRRGKWYRKAAAGVLALVAILALVSGAYWSWFTLRPQPVAVREEWHPGVVYERQVTRYPQALVAHLVRVDLGQSLRLLFTPPDSTGEQPWNARTVSQFAREHDALVAINASFFSPFVADSPFRYYPHTGDPVRTVGYTVYDGRVLRTEHWTGAFLYLDRSGMPSFTPPGEKELVHAISGSCFLLKSGKNVAPTDEPMLYPRTALGLDQSEQLLFLLVVEGKQPGYSEGATLPEVADILRRAGAHTAINLDGGGSSAMVRKTAAGSWRLVNGTSNFSMPWWERPVATHLGVKAR